MKRAVLLVETEELKAAGVTLAEIAQASIEASSRPRKEL